MAFGGLIITKAGRLMLENAQTGTPMTVTKVQLGDGRYSGTFSDITALVNPVLTIEGEDEIMVSRIEDGILVEVRVDNSGWTQGMYFREIGIFASDGTNEVLYEYDNSGADQETIPAGDGAVSLGYRMRFVLSVSETADVNISISDAFYVTHEDLEEAMEQAGKVKSVNGKTGDVVLAAADVEAVPVSAMLAADVTVYVATTGNDATGDGSDGNPFKTIGKAVNSCPKNLNGKTYTVKLVSGTYDERVTMAGFFGGTVVVESNTSANKAVLTKMLAINDCLCTVKVNSIRFTVSASSIGINVSNSAVVYCQTDEFAGASKTNSIGVVFTNCSNGYLAACNFNDLGTAVSANTNSKVTVFSGQGAGNDVVCRAASGGVIHVTANIAGTAQYLVESSGRIYSGAQDSVPSY